MYDISLVQPMSETYCHSEYGHSSCHECQSPSPASEAPENHSSCEAESAQPTDDTSGEQTNQMLGQLPPEIATLLIVAGVAGIALPGPVGTPMLIAGCVMMWPKTFQPIELWFSRRFPKFHREGVIQIKEFVADLKRRFPDDKSL